ncbi:MAG: hypothetical protein ACR2MG_20900 [Pyrinomonadaceae bacterium]
MEKIIEENEPGENENSIIEFEAEPTTGNPSRELPIKDAEVIKETRRVEKTDDAQDTFSKFLESLPEDSSPTIIITRQPDRNSGMQFRTPCEGQEQTGTLSWNNYTDASEIHADIAKRFGGGRYTIKIKDGQRLEKNRTWTTNISDPPFLSEKEKAALELKTKSEEQLRNNETSQVFANPQVAPTEQKNPLLEAIEQLKYLKEFQNLVSPPETPTAAQPAAQPLQPAITKETIKMAIIEKALNNEALLEKAIEAVFDIPPETAETQSNTVVEVIKFAASHQSETKALLDMAFSSVGAIIANLIPKPPPVINQNAPVGLQRFKRPPGNAKPAPAPETPPQTERAVTEAMRQIEPFPFIALEG